MAEVEAARTEVDLAHDHPRGRSHAAVYRGQRFAPIAAWLSVILTIVILVALYAWTTARATRSA